MKIVRSFLVCFAIAVMAMVGGCGKASSTTATTPIITAPEEIRFIQFRSSSYQISRGELLALTTQITPNVTGQRLIWEVDDSSIAAVDSSGTVEGISPGSALVHVQLEGNDMVSCSVRVYVSATANQHLTQSDLTLYKSETYQLDLQGEHPGIELVWTSSTPNLVSVGSGSGIVTALGLGESIITAYYRYRGSNGQDDFGILGTCRVTVESKVRGVTIQPKSMTVSVGDQFFPEASVQRVDNDGDRSVIWFTSDRSIVNTVLDPDSGEVIGFKAMGVGTCVLSARPGAAQDKVATMAVTVTPKSNADISLFPQEVNVIKGKTVTLFATTDSNQPVTWTSSSTGIATVSGGVVTGISAGTVTITATTGTRNATATVIVQNPAVSEVVVSPRSVDLSIGAVQPLVASVFPSDIPQSVTWEIVAPNTGVIELDTRLSPTVITARKSGRVQVRARSTVNSDYYGLCDIVVKSPSVNQVSIAPSSVTVYQGQSAPISAQISPSNADQSINWRSLDVVVADIANGMVTGKAAGSTQIEARSSFDTTKYARMTVVVNPISIVSVSVPGSVSLAIGQNTTISATVVPNIVPAVTWRSSDESVARVSQLGGILAVGPGTATVRASSVADDTKVGDCQVRVDAASGLEFTILDRSYWYPNLGDSVSRALFMTASEKQAIANQNSNSSTSWLSDVDVSNGSAYLYLVVYMDESATNLYAYVKSLVQTGGILTVNEGLSVDPKIPANYVALPNHSYVRYVLKISKVLNPTVRSNAIIVISSN